MFMYSLSVNECAWNQKLKKILYIIIKCKIDYMHRSQLYCKNNLIAIYVSYVICTELCTMLKIKKEHCRIKYKKI